MLDTLKTFSNAIIDKVKTFKGDWSENDQSSPNYIKNKTHWTEVSEITLYNDSPTFEDNGGTYLYINTCNFSLEQDKVYTIIFDGTNYSCKSNKPNDNIIYMGNINVVAGAPDNTGEPFLIIWGKDGDINHIEIATTLSGITHTVTIKTIGEVIHKLDKKYLPDYLSKTNPTGTGSFSLNRKSNTTVGDDSFAEGYNTTASGSNSHAEGYNTTASGDTSHTEGYNTTASGNYSHAEGNNTTASGGHSHAEGYFTTASGGRSHAEGSNTTASGGHSHAEGYFTIASGMSSHAEGWQTKASSKYQHVQGKFNVDDSSNIYADIIGNGTSDAKRSNASTVDWSGNAWFAGDVYVGSTSGTNKDSGSKKLATEDYVSSLKPAITTTTLLASSWDSTAKTYSFESTYPNASYDIEIALDSTATAEQAEAFNGAQIIGSATSNVIKAYGIIPTVNIPVIVKVVKK